MLRRRILPWCCALAVPLAPVAPATAQSGDAPQVDPASPAGTEYQLPIDRARERASGGGAGGGAGGDAPLFGAGVEGREPGLARKSRSGSEAGTPRTTTTGEQPELGTSTPKTVRSQAPAPDGGGSALVAVGAGAAGVLLAGGLAGLAWRRRTMGR